MSNLQLRKKLIRLAHENPEARPEILALLREDEARPFMASKKEGHPFAGSRAASLPGKDHLVDVSNLSFDEQTQAYHKIQAALDQTVPGLLDVYTTRTQGLLGVRVKLTRLREILRPLGVGVI